MFGSSIDYAQVRVLRNEFETLMDNAPTLVSIKRAIEIIKIIGEDDGDDEVAHAMERELHEQVLAELSETSELAKEALKTKDLDFSRWFA